MFRLAFANGAETFERVRDPLAERGIAVEAVTASHGSYPLAEPPVDGSRFDAGYVFPGRLMEGGVLDAWLDVPWLNDREAVLTSRNKAGVLATLEPAGIPTPDSVLVSNPADTDALVAAYERLDAPVVVKPNSTTRGIGVAKAADLDSFLGICDYLDLVHDYRATADRSFLVQEYLASARDYRVMVLEGEVVGAVERRLPEDDVAAGRWKHNVHRGAEAVGVEPSAEIRDLAERTAAALDVPFLGVDVLVTERGAVVNETNARPTIDDSEKYDEGFYDRFAAAVRDL
ncbi:coenzyme gamma-F420-2:L-glutamate ligase [Halarchaeum acidiphilum MH1-52-1]|uniref:Coenzyme gamma-F420-2:L-glutamate ligase n=1 Tax=Halarchaeum acidiphilum MH1-52-1 TaxID=1261545 RepID=U2YH17_9EURY|nr:RimK family alpha-L-glutamate ligase [Halarchaeum acidiphilum]GAD53706.1 coenzyme gamma-F420-2:L-glutamate ligase [Halarchaeum acidiphilum MH1-52-1]